MSYDYKKNAFGKAGPMIKKRLTSLDVLRGLDIFFLCCVCPLFIALSSGPLHHFFTSSPIGIEIERHFHHVAWEGFTAHDLIMPLFLFMTGITIPFQFAKFLKGENYDRGRVALRILRRVALLWLFGMIAQGGLLDFDLQKLDLFSNTLQAIAIGYLFASIIYLTFKIRLQVILFLLLLAGFWAACTYIKVGHFGGGDFTPQGNLAEWVDQIVLGRWRDGVTYSANGTWAFSSSYQYTWILSSLTFAATVLSGTLAGELIHRNPLAPSQDKHSKPAESDDGQTVIPTGLSGHKVFLYLLLIGIVMTAAGYFWGCVPKDSFGYCPIVKKIWTPSMVLLSSGLSFLLLAFFYEVIDVLDFKWGCFLLLPFGMNSFIAYMLVHLPQNAQIKSVVSGLFYGTEHFLGTWYPFGISFMTMIVLWYILWKLYKNGKFMRL